MTRVKLTFIGSAIAAILLSFGLVMLNGCATSNTDLNTMKQAYKHYLIENTNTSKIEQKSIDEIKSTLATKEIGGIETYYIKNLDNMFSGKLRRIKNGNPLEYFKI